MEGLKRDMPNDLRTRVSVLARGGRCVNLPTFREVASRARRPLFHSMFSTWPTWKEAFMNIQSKERLRVHIRWMIRRDMPEVLQIEKASFEFPWYEDDFIRCLRQRNCIGMVAEQGERVVGF